MFDFSGHSLLSVLTKNTTQCPRPGLEPGPLAPDQESKALTMMPPRLPQLSIGEDIKFQQEKNTWPQLHVKLLSRQATLCR